jgi:hypothetical protein
MNDDWVMIVVGIFLLFFGLGKKTHVSTAMPPVKPLYPAPMRLRIILISFGILMEILAIGHLAKVLPQFH